MNVADFIKAKSDQLNADDLVGGPITVKIEAVKKGTADQPVFVKISGGHQPWKPCKTSLRVLAAIMGTDTTKWVGHWVELYRDPHVKWAGVEVGGIRIKALSAIDEPTMLQLTETRGKKAPHSIHPLAHPEVGGEQAAGGQEKGPSEPPGCLTPGQVETIRKELRKRQTAVWSPMKLELAIAKEHGVDEIDQVSADAYPKIAERLGILL